MDLALYTTVYPGVRRYLHEWYDSVRAQTDDEVALWVGLDAVSVEDAERALGDNVDAVWVAGQPGDTPGMVRQRGLARIVDEHDGVILVDADDILHPSRVATARMLLRESELAGCALRLVDEDGCDLGARFTLPDGMTPDEVFPRCNAFGLSNTAFRSSLLRRCLPIDRRAVLVDWFLSTRAWLLGGRLAFSSTEEMDYRQHPANMARVRRPYGEQQVLEDTELVHQHLELVLVTAPAGALPDRVAALRQAAADVAVFRERATSRPALLGRYIRALNELDTPPLWWSWVAHPALRHLWSTEEEVA